MAVKEITTNITTNEETLKRKVQELELKVELLEKALLFLAQRLDDTDLEVGLNANNEYLMKQILQK